MNDENLKSRYATALAHEGLDPDAAGLIEALKRAHEESLTSGMVQRAYQKWRREKENAAPSHSGVDHDNG